MLPMHTATTSGRSRLLSHSTALLLTLAAALLVIDTHLVLRSWGHHALGTCGQSCDAVTRSAYAHLFGIPLGMAAIGAHIALAVIGLFGVPRRPSLALLLTGLVLGAAVYFIGVQAFILKTWCLWCNAAHALGLTLALLVSVRVGALRASQFLMPSLVALAVAAGVVGALAVVPRNTEEARASFSVTRLVALSQGRVQLHDGLFQLDVQDLPHAGNAAAASQIVALTDYSCPHCQRVHRVLEDLLEQSPGQLGVVWLPAYRNEASGRVQGWMAALYRANAEAHRELSRELWAGRISPDEATVKAEIARLMHGDDKAVEAQLPWAEKMLALTRDIVTRNQQVIGTADLPQLMLSDEILVGDGGETGSLSRMLKDKLTLKTEARAMIECDTTDFDLGSVGPRQEMPVEVAFRNIGTATLRIEGFEDTETKRAALGQAGSWEPDSEGKINVVVLTPEKEGDFEQHIKLLSNAEQPTTLRIKGTVKAHWTLSAPAFDFGEWKIGDPRPAPRTIRVTLKQPGTLGSPASLRAGTGEFSTTIAVVKSMQSFDITVEPPENLEPGAHRVVVSLPLLPGVDLKTGKDVPRPVGAPTQITIPLTLRRS